jgi:superfamily II DNA or RNA helicase
MSLLFNRQARVRSLFPFKLRDYQRECIAAIPESGRYLVQMATGLGKSLTFASLPRRGRVLILSHREELVYQPKKYYDCSYGVEMAGEKSHGEEVVSASVQSLARRLHKFGADDFDMIICDESHHACAPTYRKIFEHFRPRLLLGFTATPNRNDGVGLEHVFDDIVFERDLEWGIRNGYLAPINCLRIYIDYDLRDVAVRMGDYSPGELEIAVNIKGANRAVAEAYEKYAKGQTLIFACSVEHARAIAREIPGAVSVIGGEERDKTLEAFKKNEIRCLVNCMVFTEGTDLPNIETVMIARPTQNISLYQQMVGRGTRVYPGKEKLTLIDCVGACDDINLCTAPSLLGLDLKMVEKKKEIEGDLFDLPGRIKREVDNPRCWIKNVEYVDMWAKGRKYNTHNVLYFKMPDGSMVLSKPKLHIPPEDSLGRTVWNGAKIPTQKVFDELYSSLRKNYQDYKYLWDLSNVRRWGAYQATEKQMNKVRKIWPDAGELTKLEAMQVLMRCWA